LDDLRPASLAVFGQLGLHTSAAPAWPIRLTAGRDVGRGTTFFPRHRCLLRGAFGAYRGGTHTRKSDAAGRISTDAQGLPFGFNKHPAQHPSEKDTSFLVDSSPEMDAHSHAFKADALSRLSWIIQKRASFDDSFDLRPLESAAPPNTAKAYGSFGMIDADVQFHLVLPLVPERDGV
jgi:hypothetical protein